MAHVQDLWFRESGGEKIPTARHSHGKRWQARWLDPNGKPRTRLFARKVDADTHVAAMRADVARGTYIDPAAGKVRLRDYAEQWFAAQTSDPSSRQQVKHRLTGHIYPALGDRELRTLMPSMVRAWLRELSRTLAPNTVRAIYTTLSAILSAAVEDDLIRKNPCASSSVKLPAAPRRKVVPWPLERVEAIREALPPQYRATVDAGAGVGMRQGEVFGLAVDDIDWLRGVVHVVRQVRIVDGALVFAPPKGGKERDVPLAEEVGLRFAAHVQLFPAREVTLPWREPGGKPVTARVLFTSARGGAVNRTTFNEYVWRPALEAVGVTPTRETGMHQLRHWFASVQLDAGTSIRALAEYLGHHDPGFTLRTYTHLMPASEDRARKAIDQAFRGYRSAPEGTQREQASDA
jgi:integrase